MSDTKQKKKFVIEFKHLVYLVVFLWTLSWVLIDVCISNETNRGTFGDKFGATNALFSGLALAGVIYSLFLQKKELQLQRKELRDTREEFKQQNFESTFFNLLKNQQEITKGIHAKFYELTSLTEGKTNDVNGLDFFVYSKNELLLIGRSLKSTSHDTYSHEYYLLNPATSSEEEDEMLKVAKVEYVNTIYSINKELWEKGKKTEKIEKATFVYQVFYNRFHYALGHYFRHFYHILKFIEENESKDLARFKKENEIAIIKAKYSRYAQFVQAQMSSPELFLLFYNCTKYPKALNLVKKYNILENLTVEDLLHKNHNCIDGLTLKSRAIV